MSIPLVVNGAVFNYPQNFDEEWGVDATGWAVAVTAGMLSLSGGNFPLTAPVNFGTSFGINVKSLTSITANPATVGYLLLAKTDTISFRNNANTGNLLLGIDGSNNLTFNGAPLGTTSLTNTHIYVGNVSNVPTDVPVSGDATMANTGALTIANGAITDAKVNASAAIALSKLAALTPSQLVVADGSGFLSSAASPSLTQLGYVAGVTSAIQTQINAIGQVPSGAMMDFGGTVSPAGWLVCDGSSYATVTYPTLFAAIGYAWGGSGANFNVPGMSRRVSMGSGGSPTAVIGNAVGNIGGAETVTPIVNISDPTHNHSQNAHQHVTPVTSQTGIVPASDANSWPYGTTTLGLGGVYASAGSLGAGSRPWLLTSPTTAINNASATGITASSTAISIVQLSAIVLKIIKI